MTEKSHFVPADVKAVASKKLQEEIAKELEEVATATSDDENKAKFDKLLSEAEVPSEST